ncbi:MAG: zinc-dependent alcohol dehydrogenase family protein [Candidatus Aminicenantes bacterium]|nr:zinc-dependent alcohol dehydrogenase family protein [Candidatus Aminicenantes bacterium]
MRAMMLKKFAPVETVPLKPVELSVPEPGAGEVRVRVRVCGVCHTDLHTVEGELPGAKLPRIPGHQVVGVVEKRGKDAERFQEGERVGAAWLYSSCGRCEFCKRGDENLCLQARFTGFHAHGGFAQYMIAPEAFLYALPPEFTDIEAAPLLCAGIVGYRSLRLSGVREGQRLGLFGFGASAHVTIQVARSMGCEVFVFSRSAAHRKLARELGAAWVGTINSKLPVKLHGSVIFAPAGELVPEALRLTERGGAVALAGIYMTPVPSLDYEQHLYQERALRSVANATRRDGEELLAAAARIPIKTRTTTFPLEMANEALLLVKQGEVNGAAVLTVD